MEIIVIKDCIKFFTSHKLYKQSLLIGRKYSIAEKIQRSLYIYYILWKRQKKKKKLISFKCRKYDSFSAMFWEYILACEKKN